MGMQDAHTSNHLPCDCVHAPVHHDCCEYAIMTYAIVRTNTRRWKHGKPYMLSRTYQTLDAALLAALELSLNGLRFQYQIVGI